MGAEIERSMVTGLSNETFTTGLANTLETEGFLLVQNAAPHGRNPKEAVADTCARERQEQDVGPRERVGAPALRLRTDVVEGVGEGVLVVESEVLYAKLLREFSEQQEAVMEPWEVVRDVLLTWPCGPHKEQIESCRYLLEQQVWVENLNPRL